MIVQLSDGMILELTTAGGSGGHLRGVARQRVARAAVVDIATGQPAEGGSTITQQLVKIQLLSPQKSAARKLNEAFLAWAVEHRYTKDQVLEMYLNRVYYGHGAYGIGSAAKTYF